MKNVFIKTLHHYILVVLFPEYDSAYINFNKCTFIDDDVFRISCTRNVTFSEGIKYLNQHRMKMEYKPEYKAFHAMKE